MSCSTCISLFIKIYNLSLEDSVVPYPTLFRKMISLYIHPLVVMLKMCCMSCVGERANCGQTVTSALFVLAYPVAVMCLFTMTTHCN